MLYCCDIVSPITDGMISDTHSQGCSLVSNSRKHNSRCTTEDYPQTNLDEWLNIEHFVKQSTRHIHFVNCTTNLNIALNIPSQGCLYFMLTNQKKIRQSDGLHDAVLVHPLPVVVLVLSINLEGRRFKKEQQEIMKDEITEQ